MDMNARHKAVWTAIDELAFGLGMSPSALARKAGLDMTSFNPSKRVEGGRLRWPSMETISAVLIFTGTSYADFFAYVDELVRGDSTPPPPRPRIMAPKGTHRP